MFYFCFKNPDIEWNFQHCCLEVVKQAAAAELLFLPQPLGFSGVTLLFLIGTVS